MRLGVKLKSLCLLVVIGAVLIGCATQKPVRPPVVEQPSQEQPKDKKPPQGQQQQDQQQQDGTVKKP